MPARPQADAPMPPTEILVALQTLGSGTTIRVTVVNASGQRESFCAVLELQGLNTWVLKRRPFEPALPIPQDGVSYLSIVAEGENRKQPAPPAAGHLQVSRAQLHAPDGLPAVPRPLAVDELHSDACRKVSAMLTTFLQGRKPYEPCVPPNTDPRLDAQKAFELYLSNMATIIAHSDWLSLKQDNTRVPIACNTGTSGTGKTTQLQLLSEFASKKGFICVYFSLNGESSTDQELDKAQAPTVRLACRILHGLVSDCVTLARFLSAYAKIREEAASDAFDDDVKANLPSIIRTVWQKPKSTSILIAADELRMWGQAPSAGEFSTTAAGCLRALAQISQNAAVACIQSKHEENSDDRHGPVYVAASALSAYDPSKGVTEGSNRPVYFLPLPPLDPQRYDAVVNAFVAKAPKCDQKEVKLLLRAGLFASRHNARDLSAAALSINAMTPTIAAAEAFWERNFGAFEPSDAISNLNGASRVLIDQQKLLRTLFHRTPHGNNTMTFGGDMQSALHCDAAGIATILRNVAEGTDAVCMHPHAIEAVMDQTRLTKFNNPIDDEKRKLLGKLCNALSGVAALPPRAGRSSDPSDSEVGKRYEEIVVFALAMRVNTMPKEMTLYELITGRPPPKADKSFFATTMVEPMTTSLCEASTAFCFPRAAFKCEPPLDPITFNTKMANLCPAWKLTPNSSWTVTPTSPWANCAFHPPDCDQDFYAHFAHPCNLVLDGCILLNARYQGQQGTRKLLLGTQCKEYAPEVIQNCSFEKIHEDAISGQSSWKEHGAALAWLGDMEVVTVYAGPNQDKSQPHVPSAGLVHGQLSPARLSESNIAKKFKHWCYMHHDHIRQWSPSVAYNGCDARVLGPIESQTDALATF